MDDELWLPSNGQGSTQDKQILGFKGFLTFCHPLLPPAVGRCSGIFDRT